MNIINPDEIAEQTKILQKLNKKQRRFVEMYVITGSAYKSAVEAGYSPKKAYSIASNLLKNPKIKKAIELKRAEVKLRYNVGEEYFIKHLKDIIDSDKVKIRDKISALALLAKITGIIKEQPPQAKQLVMFRLENGTEKVVEIESTE